MTTATQEDPYILPMPRPDSPVILDRYAGGMNQDQTSYYRDSIWSLAALSDNPSATRHSINWDTIPQNSLVPQLRLAAWTMLNGELRPSFVAERGGKPLRSRLSAAAMFQTVLEWFKLAKWLTERGIDGLAQCDESTWEEYGKHTLAKGYTNRDSVRQVLFALTRLWAFDQLSAQPAGITRPPWDAKGVDEYLPATNSSGGENATEPLSEQTVGPLLAWAIRFVEDLSDDILNAWAEYQRLREAGRTNTSTPEGSDAVRAYTERLISDRLPVPATNFKGTRFAGTYVAAVTGASRSQVKLASERLGLAALAQTRPGPCPIHVPVAGLIGSTPWRDPFNYYEIPSLMRHLGTAAFIVCAYLTGMRPGEILGLRSGSCPDPVPDTAGRVGHHLIRSREYKTATDHDGNHHSAGAERDAPWVAITPVVNAIRVLERMVPDGELLFSHNSHDLANRKDTGSLKQNALRTRLADFVSWANAEAVKHRRPSEVIPVDPGGPITANRFRRSLAWHIARRPNGLVAVAIQYGHMRTLVTEGYASRSRGGIHDLLDIETARAVADTIATLRDDLDAGGGVSGPAARRAITSAANAPRFEGVTITVRTARQLLTNPDAVLYDNPQALLLCHYKRERALCHRDGAKDTPSLDRCIPLCGNVVRTDHHAAKLRQRAELLDRRADHTPGPLGERLHENAAKLCAYADGHDRTRITIDDKKDKDVQ